ncbi:gas vesicle protein [Sphaerobacter thermophilus]|uniref:gas vesicle protein n=1 Tax=Sphaerobacter thermophilus TaxID=2057 RepID=UPI000DB07FD7|nr:MAG: gas vesicle protein [Sphaerobacter thermophilus]
MSSSGDRPAITRHQDSPYRPRPGSPRAAAGVQPTNLADLLERVLDKGIVIAGDITLSLGTVEVLSLKIRLLIASIDKAQEIGINWWQFDPALSSNARTPELEANGLGERLDRIEAQLAALARQPSEEPAESRNAGPGEA